MADSMPPRTPPTDPIAVRLRQFWKRWGQATIVAVVAHLCIGAAIVVLYYVTKPPPPRFVVVDLIAPSASVAPTATPAAP
ncbi:MAG TPA: hypothetical protein VGE51_02725 [Fontimonas sp.]